MKQLGCPIWAHHGRWGSLEKRVRLGATQAAGQKGDRVREARAPRHRYERAGAEQGW